MVLEWRNEVRGCVTLWTVSCKSEKLNAGVIGISIKCVQVNGKSCGLYILCWIIVCGISGQGRAGWLQRRGTTLWIGSTKCHSSPLTPGCASKAVLLWNIFAPGFAAWRQKVYLMYGPCTVFLVACVIQPWEGRTTKRKDRRTTQLMQQIYGDAMAERIWREFRCSETKVMMILLRVSKVIPW